MKSIVETIYDAQKGAYEIVKVTETHGEFTIPQAYVYQRELMNRLVKEGATISGYKMGLTSREKMEQMGVESPIYGVLLEEWDIKDHSMPLTNRIHPKAEPEIAFKMKSDVKIDATDEELENAIGWIAPATEVIDSRYLNFKFTMADVVADNCSSAAYSCGEWVEYPVKDLDIKNIKMKLKINGEVKGEGMSSNILGNPFESLKELHKNLAKEGIELKAGQVVLLGAATAAQVIKAGDIVETETDSIGKAIFTVGKDKELIKKIADSLWDADKGYYTIPQISAEYEGLTIDDAYAIQGVNKDRMVKNGEVITGKKIGLTSLAMQKSLGVDQPDYGYLYASMDVSNTNVVPKNTVVQPRVEGEFMFKLKKSLRGKVTAADVLDATEWVVPAIEVVGSRIANWKLTIVDTISDNASCGMYLLGDKKIDPKEVDLRNIHMDLLKNGEVINGGEGSAVLGDPAESVAWLAYCLGQFGTTLDKGDLVLSGALSAAVPAASGDKFVVDFGEYGQVKVDFE